MIFILEVYICSNLHAALPVLGLAKLAVGMCICSNKPHNYLNSQKLLANGQMFRPIWNKGKKHNIFL